MSEVFEEPRAPRLLKRVNSGCAVGCVPQFVLLFLALSGGPWWLLPCGLFGIPVLAVAWVHLRAVDGARVQAGKAVLDLVVIFGISLAFLYFMGGPVVTRYSGFDGSPVAVDGNVEFRIEALGDWESRGRVSRQVGPFRIRVRIDGARGGAVRSASLIPRDGDPIPLSTDHERFNDHSIVVFQAVPLNEVEHRFMATYISPSGGQTQVDAVLRWRVRRTMSLASFEQLMGV